MLGTKILEISMGRDFGDPKGLTNGERVIRDTTAVSRYPYTRYAYINKGSAPRAADAARYASGRKDTSY